LVKTGSKPTEVSGEQQGNEVASLKAELNRLRQALSQAGDSIELQEAEQRGFVRGVAEKEAEIEKLWHSAEEYKHWYEITAKEVDALRAALRNIADPSTDLEAGVEIARAALAAHGDGVDLLQPPGLVAEPQAKLSRQQEEIASLKAEVERLSVSHDKVLRANRLIEANEALRAERDALREAAANLIADVRRRYPGEDLRCPYMIALDAALAHGSLRSEPVPSSDWVFIRNEGDKSLWENSETDEQEWFFLAHGEEK
jgi:chromosome segregation ATPase